MFNKKLSGNNLDIYKMLISSIVHLDLNYIDMKIKSTELLASNEYEYNHIFIKLSLEGGYI